MNAYLERCVLDRIASPQLPNDMSTAQAVAQLEKLREQRRAAASEARRYMNQAGSNVAAREGQRGAAYLFDQQAKHATALIRRFQAQARS